MLVPVGAGLLHEDHLIDPGILVALQMRAQLIGRADTATARVVRQPVLHLQELLPHIGDAGPVFAEYAI